MYPPSINILSNHNLCMLHLQYGADPHYNLCGRSMFDESVKSCNHNLINYILTYYPIDINTYIVPADDLKLIDTVTSITRGSIFLTLIPIFLKHGLDYNYKRLRWGLAALCWNMPDVVSEILKYPVDISILKSDLIAIGEGLLSGKLISEEIKRRESAIM